MADHKKIVSSGDRFVIDQQKHVNIVLLVFLFMTIAKTKGQIEDTISKEVAKYYVSTLGVGPRQTKVYILQDMVIIRLYGKLLPLEQKLLEADNGVELVKDIRKALHEITSHGLNDVIKKITGQKVISSHSDISTKTHEIMQIFVLNNNLEELFKK